MERAHGQLQTGLSRDVSGLASRPGCLFWSLALSPSSSPPPPPPPYLLSLFLLLPSTAPGPPVWGDRPNGRAPANCLCVKHPWCWGFTPGMYCVLSDAFQAKSRLHIQTRRAFLYVRGPPCQFTPPLSLSLRVLLCQALPHLPSNSI